MTLAAIFLWGLTVGSHEITQNIFYTKIPIFSFSIKT